MTAFRFPDAGPPLRLLEVLLRTGGSAVAIYEGYFDESGGFDDASKVFCISGYFIEADAAKEMTAAWVKVLEEHRLPFFHMVDCAHGDWPFDGMEVGERVEVEKKLIALVKAHTMKGFSAVAHADYFKPTESRPDAYVACAEMCMQALSGLLELGGAKGRVAYIFEAGHGSQSIAYKLLAEKLKNEDASVTFGRKRAFPLLQAADLLAWQTAKYVKDGMSKARKPRADFLSLMEHDHDFAFMVHSGEAESMTWESWPANRRSAKTSTLELHTGKKIPYFVENDDGVPVFPAQMAEGWKQSSGQMVFVAYKNLLDKQRFAVSFDERALEQSLLVHIWALGTYAGSDNLTRFLEHAKFSLARLEESNKKARGE